MRIRRGASLADLEGIYRARFGAFVRVYIENGPPIWGAEHKAIQLVYANGAVPKGPVSMRPNYEGPYVVVHQANDPQAIFFLRAAIGYTPPEGSILFFGGFAILKHDGIYVAIQGSSEELILSAARALKPLSAGSGAGE